MSSKWGEFLFDPQSAFQFQRALALAALDVLMYASTPLSLSSLMRATSLQESRFLFLIPLFWASKEKSSVEIQNYRCFNSWHVGAEECRDWLRSTSRIARLSVCLIVCCENAMSGTGRRCLPPLWHQVRGRGAETINMLSIMTTRRRPINLVCQ